MQGCVVDNWFSILINGTSKGLFKASRGLIQGDPLSPLLFTLVADGISASFRRVEQRRLVEGFVVGDDRIMVSHLQFVDETILILQEDRANIRKVDRCIKVFETISDLKVNMGKSCLVGINLSDEAVLSLAAEMGCEVGSWPLKYLGMPLGGNSRVISFWNPVVEKISRKLSC